MWFRTIPLVGYDEFMYLFWRDVQLDTRDLRRIWKILWHAQATFSEISRPSWFKCNKKIGIRKRQTPVTLSRPVSEHVLCHGSTLSNSTFQTWELRFAESMPSNLMVCFRWNFNPRWLHSSTRIVRHHMNFAFSSLIISATPKRCSDVI